ncbi:MAG: dockerin type I repeat-containing protein [Oscillospiraceae bacterium]|nr:dockerin type I repeat-containing protein [Oscillospiraceae bacterium]
MKKSVKRIITMVAALAMLSTSALSASAATINNVKDVNALPYTAGMDATKADAIVVTSATSAMEQKAYEIIAKQFNAKRADRDAIVERVAAMSPEEIKAAIADTTTLIASSADIKATMDAAVEELNKTVAEINASNSDATIVVTNIYNPFNFAEGGATVAAAQAAVQVYVDELNAKINTIKKDIPNVVVSDLSDIKPATVITAETITSGAAASTAMDAAFTQQTTAKNNTVNTTQVVADAVTYKYGDLNNDGKVKAVDLVIMLQYQIGTLTDEVVAEKGYTIAAGDLVKDGKACDTADLMLMKLFLLQDATEADLGAVQF